MVAIQGKIEASLKGAKRVGKKRAAQTKDIAKTMAGRFGARLAELADKAGLTADDLAVRLDKSPAMIRFYFAGRNVPHINDWPGIAKALGVQVSDLLPK